MLRAMTLFRTTTTIFAAFCFFSSTAFSRGGSWLESLFPSAAASPRSSAQVPSYTLRAEKTWQLNFPRGKQFDASGLAKWAAEKGTALRLLVRPGDFVFPGAPIALMTPTVDGAAEAIRVP